MTDDVAVARTGRVVWTAKEAMACAYCWAEFSRPEETHPHTTPEAYWLGITERARNECREITKRRLLLSVARGQSVAVPSAYDLQEGQLETLGKAMGLKQRSRIIAIITALRSALVPYHKAPVANGDFAPATLETPSIGDGDAGRG